MATRNHSRGTRLIGRSAGNRPRTHPTRKPRRKPAPKKAPRLRTTGNALRHAKRIRGSRDTEQPQTSPTLPGHEILDRVPAEALRQIRRKIDLACSTALVVQHALREQNVELDEDAADVLQIYVSDLLFGQVLALDRLLGDDDDGEADDDDGGAV